MPKVKRQSFDHLSEAEREVVGSPDDYDWDHALGLPARRRRSVSAQFSVRIDRTDMDAIQAIAATRGITFSEAVRDAIRRYVAAGGSPALTNIHVSVGSIGILRSEGRSAELQPNRAEPVTADLHLESEPPRTVVGSA